ncbi:hypothetical protein ACTJJ7_19490 [Phyllobacterium sp. 22229]|uniref:hypothetical protein n=1 Tax=Phyllobacterium sp. 22229 TaxID=3453895 RepID=UPI003F86B3D5
MVTYEELVEKVARAEHAVKRTQWVIQGFYDKKNNRHSIRDTSKTKNQEVWFLATEDYQDGHETMMAEIDRINARDRAKAAIATIRVALQEPSKTMIRDIIEACNGCHCDCCREKVKLTLSAALAASPLVEEERKTVSNENSGENDRCPY